MENTVAVVSFSKNNKDLHRMIARTVIPDHIEIHAIYLGGVTNASTLGLLSKVDTLGMFLMPFIS